MTRAGIPSMLAAGSVGTTILPIGPQATTATVAAAMAAAVVVNTVGRFLVILERQPRLLLDLWPRGIRVDLLEAVLVVPVLSVLLIAAFVLMIQVFIDKNPQMFETALQRADIRLFLLSAILGLIGWAALARLLRALNLPE